jgi:hypothetical protein
MSAEWNVYHRWAETAPARDAGLTPNMSRLQPGEYGMWQVWGACPDDIRPNDLVLFSDGASFTVADTFRPRAWPCRIGFTTYDVNPDGQRLTVGRLSPVGLMRPGTHHTLGEHVR